MTINLKEQISRTTQLPEYPNLYFYNKEHLEEALKFSETNLETIEPNRDLKTTLGWLNGLTERCKDIALISPDFVKHSFYFQLYRPKCEHEAEYDFNGGLILHGYEETYSVELTSSNKPHWSIHT